MNKNQHLTLPFGGILALIAGTPVLILSYGGLGPQLLTLWTAVLLVLLSATPSNDVKRARATFAVLWPAAIFPILWMLLQLVPLPFEAVQQPIWHTAAAALSERLTNHISIDLGMTLRALFFYLTLLCLCFCTAVSDQNRDRAETFLLSLCAITTFVAIERILFRDFSAIKPDSDYLHPMIACAAFGLILNTGFITRTAERRETRGEREGLHRYIAVMLAGIAGAAICAAALVYSATTNTLIATAFGISVLGLIVLIRHLALRRWTALVTGSAVFIVCAGIVTLRFSANASIAAPLRFTDVDSGTANATMRMMSDANWFGSGVGSYQALAAIYRDIDGLPGPYALNSFVALFLGWGSLGFLIAAASLLLLFTVLFRGAILRGRDSFYAGTAAACVVVAWTEAYCDVSFTDPAVGMLAAIIVGLGLAQTVGQHR